MSSSLEQEIKTFERAAKEGDDHIYYMMMESICRYAVEIGYRPDNEEDGEDEESYVEAFIRDYRAGKVIDYQL